MGRGRVALAMSGGVDSSVGAHLLVEDGYEVVGLFMRTGTEAPAGSGVRAKVRGCCSAIDAGDAQRVADRLDIPFYALDFEEDFGRIKDYFALEYARGRTPNPCAVCNTWLKFGRLWDYARDIGADWIATGHYARSLAGPTGHELHRGIDPAKDQSYFLFGLQKDLLERTIFPVGGMHKAEVRNLAWQLDLGIHAKPDSQEICFVPDGDYHGFIRRHRPEAAGTPGEIVDHDGRVVGRHDGLAGFTIGQRKGLGVALGQPRYVLEIVPEANRVVIGPRDRLARTSLEAEEVNWLTPSEPAGPVECCVKIRYLHEPAPAVVEPIGPDCARIRFHQPQSAITPGQAVVFYDGSRVLGGGWIR